MQEGMMERPCPSNSLNAPSSKAYQRPEPTLKASAACICGQPAPCYRYPRSELAGSWVECPLTDQTPSALMISPTCISLPTPQDDLAYLNYRDPTLPPHQPMRTFQALLHTSLPVASSCTLAVYGLETSQHGEGRGCRGGCAGGGLTGLLLLLRGRRRRALQGCSRCAAQLPICSLPRRQGQAVAPCLPIT